MNYYPRNVGDYARDTAGLTQGEHGAYNLLIDAAYATENGVEADEVHSIAKATNAAERKNVDKVVRKFFVLREGRYYQKRIEEEVAAYRDKASKASSSANKRWKKGAKPVDKQMPSDMRTHMPQQVPPDEPSQIDGSASAMLTSNQEPINPNTAFPVVETSRPEPPPNSGTEKNAKLEAERPGMLKLLEKHRVMGVEDHPLIVDRLLRIAKHEHITQAFHEAGRAKGGAPYDIGFYATILERIAAAAREADEQQRAAAEARLKATQDQIADQREMAKAAVPMPDELRNLRFMQGPT